MVNPVQGATQSDVNCKHASSSAEAAAGVYIEHGWSPIPVPAGSKAPIVTGWQNLRISAEQVPSCFALGSNVGLVLGSASGGLVDVDLDCTEAVKAAQYFLPATRMIHGRQGNPHSHRWYICSEAKKTQQYKHPETGAMLVELRSNGAQTLAPPSVHPSGEKLVWLTEIEPSVVSAEDLVRGVKQIAAVALIAQHWHSGSRNNLALPLGGMLARVDSTKRPASNW